jgi:hypothetical protein
VEVAAMAENPRFNPALYVVQAPDGTRYIPLEAQRLWMNFERPGWRITSDGIKLMGIERTNEETGKPEIHYLAVLHVAVLDNEGRRVVSIPVSCSINEPDFADILFEEGTRRALDHLGYNIYRITTAQWNELYHLRYNRPEMGKREEPTTIEKAASLAETALKNLVPAFRKESVPPKADGFSGVVPAPVPVNPVPGNLPGIAGLEKITPLHQVPSDDSPATGAGDEGPSLQIAMDLFEDLKRSNPELSKKFQDNFERFCYGAVGISWQIGDAQERTAIIEELRKQIGRRDGA